MTPSITACPPTSVSSPLSSTGINCMSAESRRKRVGDTIDTPFTHCTTVIFRVAYTRYTRSSQKLLHHVPLHVGQAELAAHVAIGQAGVVHSQAVQNGGLQVMHVDRVFGDVEAQVIGLAHHLSAFDAAARHPHAVGDGMMVPSGASGV